jgi:hypothetical protein
MILMLYPLDSKTIKKTQNKVTIFYPIHKVTTLSIKKADFSPLLKLVFTF